MLSNNEPRTTNNEFQPICGTGSRPSNLRTSPRMNPSPAVLPISSETSNSSWWPTQMPNSDAPRLTAVFSAASMRFSRSQFIAAIKLPTPGSTILFALATASGSRVRRKSAPACRSARAMLATFATGESIKVTPIRFVIPSVSERPGRGWHRCTAPPPRSLATLGMTSLNHSFRGRHAAADHLLRIAHRDRERFENRFRRVMSVAAANQIDVDVARALVREGFEKLLDEREWKIFVDEQHLAVDRHFEHEVRPAGEVDHHARERLVERHVRVAETADACFVAEGFAECFA